MRYKSVRCVLGLATVMAFAMSHTTYAEMPKGRPFSMRGVELGITLAEFWATPVVSDSDHKNLQRWCTHNDLPKGIWFNNVTDEETSDGIISCQWFSAMKSTSSLNLSQHWVELGAGKGPPTFQFIQDAGVWRLFRIKFYANNEYYPGIADALTRNYGVPKDKVEPFQTLAGSMFTSTTSQWSNGISSITLVQRCAHLERYCLTYDHTALSKIYQAIVEKRKAAAAGKI